MYTVPLHIMSSATCGGRVAKSGGISESITLVKGLGGWL